ncbi:MAG: hypothetical protein E7175_02085 [Erysipelotrichaceae bacterium]|nr:hypothetical protein [Erysipelotrichaceae bacterium]
MDERDNRPHFWLIPYSIILLLIIGLSGGIATIVIQDLIYLEVALVLGGLFDLLFLVIRIFFRDRVNYRKNKSVFEDTKAPEYKEFMVNQWILAAIGIGLLLISVIIFLIRR